MQMNQVRDCFVCGRGPFFPSGELKLGRAANSFEKMSVFSFHLPPTHFLYLCESVTYNLLYPSPFPFPLPAFSFLYSSLPSPFSLLPSSQPLLHVNLFILRLYNVCLKRAAIAKNNLKFILDTKVSF